MQKETLPPHQKDGMGGTKTMILADLTNKQVICKTFVPGDKMDSHQAPTDVFALVLDGQMDITLANETNRFGAGEYLTIPATMMHALTCIETARMLIYK
ncbi:MAG: cupin domain-containing protein [Rudanella sp.]|nr:cupin domain-containing protein [Rudanella sp.]